MRNGSASNICLVADDDMFIRSIIARNLDPMAQVVQVQDGADCVAAYKQHMPDIAFIDVHLPILTGPEIVRQVLLFDPQAYIVLISSDSTPENVQSAARNGAKGFLAKPISRERLMHYFTSCPTISWRDGASG